LKSMISVDFTRFEPSDGVKKLLGFDEFIVFSSNPSDGSSGYLLKCDSVADLLSGLKKVEDKLTGVLSGDLKVNREAVMRKKVDIILDSPERRLDYGTLKLAAEKDVIIELSLFKFLNTAGLKRLRLFGETNDVLRVLKKFDVPYIFTSGAEEFYQLRHSKQINDFFAFLGAEVEKSDHNKERIVKRISSDNYIIDGVELEP